MKYHPVQLISHSGIDLPGIVLYPVNTDINLPFYRATFIGQIKGDNVCIIVVVEILSIDLEQIINRAENIPHCR